jgi:hypothetical protein
VVTPVVDPVITASPSSLAVTQGGSVTSTISTPALAGETVTFGTTTLPAGVTATFNPSSVAAGDRTTMTVSASATAQPTANPIPFSVIGTFRTSGGSTTTADSNTLTLRINAATGGNGGVTVTPVVASSGPWFNEEDVRIANSGALTALSVTVVLQRTTGVSFNGQFNTAGSQITQGSSSTASTITYQFNLTAGQTLGASAGWTFAAQTSGSGTAHPTSGDTFTVTYTTGGQSFTQTGHF